MSLFAGGSECAGNSNPLAQLSKRTQADTSLQASMRNGTRVDAGGGQLANMHRNMEMGQQNQTMMADFMHQGSSLAPTAQAFNFQPMAHELDRVLQHAPQQQQQLQQGSQNWTAEFASTHAVSAARDAAQNRPEVHYQQPAPQMNSRFMLHANVPAQTFRMRNPMMESSRQTQSQPQHVEAADKLDWEDSFKEIEQHVEAAQTDDVQVGESNSPFDEMAETSPLKFNEKYHDEYQFEEKNEFLNNPKAYEIGCRLMEGGAKLSEAALAFEAAVQDNAKHVDAWLKLGQVQIQNEKELQGITALENCLLLDNRNQTALMSLAISYVNEGYDNAAFKTFENWIETKYPEIVSKARMENPNDTSDDRYSLNKRITNLFLKAAQLSPSGVNIDADVQTGLGVLFYSMEEYDKTLDCFQAAIRCNPNDALSWNRLGASYANSNRPEQAIEAYSKALQLNPNFVRARYNLGVSFINMGMYNDAVDHLLTGLSMHEVEDPDNGQMLVGDTEQSSNLIETLKRAFLAMDRRDLIDKVRPGMDVNKFRSQLNV